MSIPVRSSTATTDVDDVSTLMMMPLVTSTSTNGQSLDTSMSDLIAEHDRPYSEYGHLSMSQFFDKTKRILLLSVI
jgi:hypothetical protein